MNTAVRSTSTRRYAFGPLAHIGVYLDDSTYLLCNMKYHPTWGLLPELLPAVCRPTVHATKKCRRCRYQVAGNKAGAALVGGAKLNCLIHNQNRWKLSIEVWAQEDGTVAESLRIACKARGRLPPLAPGAKQCKHAEQMIIIMP